MEEEIDLRPYLVIIFRYWYWIVGWAIVAALVAFIVSSSIPPTYEASALVTATQSRYELQFDPRFRNIPDSAIQSLLESQYRTYPTLATSDDLLQEVASKTGGGLNGLKRAIQAEAEDAPNLLALTVRGQDAQKVADIANIWAKLFVEKANTLYGSSGELGRFRQQQEIVAQSLSEADAAITAFREENGFGFVGGGGGGTVNITMAESDSGSNPFGLIGRRLQSKTRLLTDYEAELVRLHQLQREVELLSAATDDNTSPVLIAGLLSEMINIGIVQDDNQIYQIKLDSIDPGSSLVAMATALESRATATEAETELLREDIADLQAELATKQEQLEQLTRVRDVQAETYAVISRKVQEAQIDASSGESSAGKVQIASRAAVPTEAISSNRMLISGMAGILGLMVSVLGVFVVEWWRGGEAVATQQQSEAVPALSIASE